MAGRLGGEEDVGERGGGRGRGRGSVRLMLELSGNQEITIATERLSWLSGWSVGWLAGK